MSFDHFGRPPSEKPSASFLGIGTGPAARDQRLEADKQGRLPCLPSWLVRRLESSVEQRFAAWVERLRAQGPLPLRIRLWTQQEWLLAEPADIQVTIDVVSASALPYLLEPSLSNLGEAYVEGLLNVTGELPAIVDMAHQLAQRSLKPEGLWGRVAHRYVHGKKDDKAAIEHHYNVSNDFYRLWLDPEMIYSCAYFETGSETLAEAQLKKLDHILTKVQAQPNDRLLDVGCGWGALVIRAAQVYGCRCTGITLSEQQFSFAQARVRELGLEDRVEIRLQDYRDVRGEFERITSVGMFEHVGVAQLADYFGVLKGLLSDHGVVVNHGITTSDPGDGQTAYGGGDFISKYVFPGGELAHIGTVLTAMQRGGLEVTDVEGLRRHYAQTLRLWASSFEAQSETVRKMVGEKKFRIWRTYLIGSAYAFEHDEISLFQVVCHQAGKSVNELLWSRKHQYCR
jgi:cyclopropane-fatty-acyl-phospholipid synthase